MVSEAQDRKLDEILTNACEAIGVDGGTVFVVDGDRLRFQVVRGEKSQRIKEMESQLTLQLGQGICGMVAKNGESLIVNDPEANPNFNPKVDLMTGFWSMSILAVPIKTGDRVLGVMELVNKKVKFFTKEDQGVLEGFAAQAAAVLTEV